MRCPRCQDRTLAPAMTREGVEIDRCPACAGVWLDGGEIFHFAKRPRTVSANLATARAAARPTGLLSPRTGKPMVEIAYPGNLRLDYCEATQGLWFDSGEIEKVADRGEDFRIRPLPARAAAAGRGAAALLALPNLWLRSTATLVGLYALLSLVLIAAALAYDLPAGAALAVGAGVLALQFLIGPFLMDLSLRWLYRMTWVERERLPRHLVDFVARLCAERRIPFPRFGLIDDGGPQAFTYGHAPGNARIVLSRGLIERLDANELEAVVAHEIGHAVHWDMLLMTAAQLVPLVLYYVYRTLLRVRGRKVEAPARLIALGAFVLYIVSEYVVLWFSRTREYHADRFAGAATGDPAGLASALVKIAYGLAGREPAGKDAAAPRAPGFEAVSALGIFDADAARGLALVAYAGEDSAGRAVDKDALVGAMRWDLWNPWAKWFELHSTHPLVANRLRYLANQALALGKPPFVVFDEARPESYWDEFLVDLGMLLLPWLATVGAAIAYILVAAGGTAAGVDWNHFAAAVAGALGAALVARFVFVYPGNFFPPMTVAALLGKVKVSAVRPVPCTVAGVIVGRGVAGYILSEDFVLEDKTGIVFLDHRQPLALWETLFGLLKGDEYQGKAVSVEGWYRRAPVPYVEIKRLARGDGKTLRSWLPIVKFAVAILVLASSFVFLAARPIPL